MKFPQVCFFLLALLAGVLSQAYMFDYPIYGGLDYFRSGVQQPQLANAEERIFLGTRTLTVATSTLTVTSTSTTTCTTSTAALSTCIASGRRRRNAGLGSLFYQEQRGQDALDSIFLPFEKRSIEEPAHVQSPPPEKPATYIPFVVQPGIAGNAKIHPQARFLLALTTSTRTITTTSILTTALTAICVSDTTWQLCGSSGK